MFKLLSVAGAFCGDHDRRFRRSRPVIRRFQANAQSTHFHVWAFKYSSDDQSPSMYYGSPNTRSSENRQNAITTIASEPSDSNAAHWFKVEERKGVHWTDRGLTHFEINI
jgi:hypothetical protein